MSYLATLVSVRQDMTRNASVVDVRLLLSGVDDSLSSTTNKLPAIF
jgi:hypothetical protein